MSFISEALVHLCIAVIESPVELKQQIWSGIEKLNLSHNQQAYIAIYYANRYIPRLCSTSS